MEAWPASHLSDHSKTALCFTLKYWCLWQSEEISRPTSWPGGQVLPCSGGYADVSFLPMLQRRRLSPLARAVCAVAWNCRKVAGNLPTVFFSNHGESQYYFQMLQDLAAGESLSPSRFSLCVHNAIAGLYSLQSESVLPYICLAGGSEGLFAAFIEASGLLLEMPQVMLIGYEQPLPPVYQTYLAGPTKTWALAMVLARQDQIGYTLRLLREPSQGVGSTAPQMDYWLQCIIDGQRSGTMVLERSVWHWSLADA